MITIINICSKTILKNSLKLLKKRANRIPTWDMVGILCGVGSSTAIEICKKYEIDPFSDKFRILDTKE